MTTREFKPPTPRTRRTYVAKPLPETGFVRLPSILAIFPISRSGLYNKVRAGEFPEPTKLGPRTSVWDVSAVREALAKLGVEA